MHAYSLPHAPARPLLWLQSLEEFKGQEHLEKNPNGQLPTLELNGEVMWESGAIMQILLEKFDTQNKLEPAKGSPLRGGAV